MTSLELGLKALVKALSEQRIKYVVLGGIAVSIYGQPRFTADIDVNIILAKKKIDKFLKKSRKYFFYPLVPNAKEIAEKTGVIPLKFSHAKTETRCDVIIAENPLEYAAIKRGKGRKIGAIKGRLISAEDLIIHKIASSRPRDREDVSGILIRQKGKLDLKYISNWLKKIDKVNKKARLCRSFEKLVKTYYE